MNVALYFGAFLSVASVLGFLVSLISEATISDPYDNEAARRVRFFIVAAGFGFVLLMAGWSAENAKVSDRLETRHARQAR